MHSPTPDKSMWDARVEAERWRRQAANDLAFARVALRERFYAQACFIAQQSAEKSVKALAYGAVSHFDQTETLPPTALASARCWATRS